MDKKINNKKEELKKQIETLTNENNRLKEENEDLINQNEFKNNQKECDFSENQTKYEIEQTPQENTLNKSNKLKIFKLKELNKKEKFSTFFSSFIYTIVLFISMFISPLIFCSTKINVFEEVFTTFDLYVIIYFLVLIIGVCHFFLYENFRILEKKEKKKIYLSCLVFYIITNLVISLFLYIAYTNVNKHIYFSDICCDIVIGEVANLFFLSNFFKFLISTRFRALDKKTKINYFVSCIVFFIITNLFTSLYIYYYYSSTFDSKILTFVVMGIVVLINIILLVFYYCALTSTIEKKNKVIFKKVIPKIDKEKHPIKLSIVKSLRYYGYCILANLLATILIPLIIVGIIIFFLFAFGDSSGSNDDVVRDEWDYVKNGYKWGKKNF